MHTDLNIKKSNSRSQSFITLSVKVSLAISTLCLSFSEALAWGRRGHSLVNTSAAYLLSEKSDSQFLKAHSFDLGFYANVPDIVWKKTETYKIEAPQHFIDLEIFLRKEAHLDTASTHQFTPKEANGFADKLATPSERMNFEKENPEIKIEAGRSWWRIDEMVGDLKKITSALNDKELKKEEHQKLQAEWLVKAGTLGHYVGDLGQPLHVTENYDGQLTEQKGIHAYFEDRVVDELYPQIASEVQKSITQKWSAFHKANSDKTIRQLSVALSLNSFAALPKLLQLDKKIGRKNLKQATAAYHGMIVERISLSALYLAEIWSRHLGWSYDGDRFYIFTSTPAYDYPVSHKQGAESANENVNESAAAKSAEKK